MAQNTRGERWGNGGCYWISYESPFTEQTVFKISDEYSEVLSYDGGQENTIQTEDTTAVANVYHKAGTLKAIGTYTTTPNQTLTIEIYDDTFEKLLYSKDVSFELKGYHTIELDKALEVSDYAVAIKYEGSAPVEGESWEDEWITYSVDINPQESYVFMDEEWKDMSEKATISKLGIDFTPNNGCIKVMY